MKKLAVVIENYVAGGANKYAEDVIHCLKDDFTSIDIYGNKSALKAFSKERLPKDAQLKEIKIYNAGESIKHLSPLTRKILRILYTPFFFFFNIASLMKLGLTFNTAKPDLILLCNGGYPASIYLDLASLFIKSDFSPSMTIVSTPIRRENFLTNPFWKFLDKVVCENNKKIIVNSLAIKNALCEHYNFPHEKIYILKNGVSDNSQLKATVKNLIQIGFISRIEEAKGIKETLSAYKRLKSKHENIKLVIAGNGSLTEDVLEAARLDPSITYLGHVTSGLSELLHSIDIYVLPSYQEGLPYSIIEASMAGCAVIATNVGGIPELIENQYSGVLIPHKNEAALYDALELLISNETLRNTYSTNARRNFVENLSIEKMAEQARKILL